MVEEPTTPEIRQLPHAIGSEKHILSSLMKFPSRLDESVVEGMFYLPAHKIVFRDIVAAQGAWELVSAVQRFHDKGELSSVGGPAGVSDIYTYAPNDYHFPEHLRRLRNRMARRMAILAAQQAAEAAFDCSEGDDSQNYLDALTGPFTAVLDAATEGVEERDTQAILRDSAKRWEEMATGKVDPMGIETSLAEFNQCFRGIKPGRVTVISGLPSEGKSLLAGQLFMDAVTQMHPGLFLTWEMSEDELMDRFLAYEVGLSMDSITDPLKFAKEVSSTTRPTEDHLRRVRGAYQKLAGLPLRVRAMHGKNINQVIAYIRKVAKSVPLKVVAIDFVQRVSPAPHLEKQSFERQLCDIADRFQNLAQELNFHGLLLSQLNKEGGAKHAEAINESCSLHLKIVNKKKTSPDGSPIIGDDGEPIILARGLGVVKDRFNGHTGKLLQIGLNKQIQRFERIEDYQ